MDEKIAVSFDIIASKGVKILLFFYIITGYILDVCGGACAHGLRVVIRGDCVWMRRLMLALSLYITRKDVMFPTVYLITARIVMFTTYVWRLFSWPRGGCKR